MITLITGFPGSGKTFKSVKNIFDIINSDTIKYDFIYTNINGFKYDKHNKLKRFDEDKFYNFLTQLYALYNIHKNQDDVDIYLIKFCKEEDYYNCYFVFDECHNFFSLKDDTKIFWLTYHRHLFHEIDLITQNKTLIHTKYRGVIEIFIDAQPRSKKILNQTLVYKKYSSFSMRKTDLFDKESLKIDNRVFALYKSGNISNQKSILLKYFKIIIFGIIVAFSLFYYLFSSLKAPANKSNISNNKNNNNKHNTKSKITQKKQTILKSNTINNLLIEIICYSDTGCILNNNIYPIKYIRKFIKTTNSKTLLTTQIYYNKDLKYRVFKILFRTNKTNLDKYFLSNNKSLNPKTSNIFNTNNSIEKNKHLKIRTHEGVRTFEVP